jgi:hypothetical protein
MSELTLAEMALHLGRLSVTMPAVGYHALDVASAMVLEECRDSIGHYQDSAGPFSAWAELADSTKADRVRRGFTENDPGLRTGQMRDSYERHVETDWAEVGSNDMHAVWFELGTKTQPPRSVIGGAAMRKEHEIYEETGRIFFAVLSSTGHPETTLANLGKPKIP